MRAIWSGAISFGLVNIPVRLYPATEDQDLHFHYLHKEDLGKIRYAKICRLDGKEIPYEDLVKGYEYIKGDFVVLTDKDFEKANRHKTRTIDILDFVKEEKIDPIYFEKPYYLEPEQGAEKAYALLREALKKSKKVGVAKFVLRNKEHLAAVKARGQVILLDQMKYQAEIRRPQGLNLPDAKLAGEREIKMALELIGQLSRDFHPEVYKDTYQGELQEVISEKAKGKTPKGKGAPPQATRVADLMEVLRESLNKEKKAPIRK